MQIFIEPNEFTYCVVKIGRLRWGWYHGIDRHSIWFVRKVKG